MNLRWFLAAGLLWITVTHAVEPLDKNLIDISTKPGMVLFQRSVNLTTLKLMSHFTTQKTSTYCGVASAVMILNASGLPAPLDSLHPSYHYFTQEDFFNADVQQIITPQEVEHHGIPLSTLQQVIQHFGLKTELFYANELSVDAFRSLIKDTIFHQKFMIVNFLRTGLMQQGGGHHSPISAYDEETDRVLLLDVARYKYPAYWVQVADLWKAMNTKDQGVYRGVLVVQPI